MFDSYQEESSKCFQKHVGGSMQQMRLLNWAIGLGGETGEIQELIKHHIYSSENLDKMQVAKELGDILWYISAIATTCDISLNDIAILNQEKLKHRYSNTIFSRIASQQRKEREIAFLDTPIYKILEANIKKTLVPVNIIFIGPDGAGKTTLSKIVAEKLGFLYHKCSYRESDKPQLAETLLNTQINIIYDRFYYPDDLIYRKVKNLPISETLIQNYESIKQLMQQRNVLFIYVTATLPVLVYRSNKWKDQYVMLEDLVTILNEYQKWFLQTPKEQCFIVNTTDIKGETEINMQADKIIEFINNARWGHIFNIKKEVQF